MALWLSAGGAADAAEGAVGGATATEALADGAGVAVAVGSGPRNASHHTTAAAPSTTGTARSASIVARGRGAGGGASSGVTTTGGTAGAGDSARASAGGATGASPSPGSRSSGARAASGIGMAISGVGTEILGGAGGPSFGTGGGASFGMGGGATAGGGGFVVAVGSGGTEIRISSSTSKGSTGCAAVVAGTSPFSSWSRRVRIRSPKAPRTCPAIRVGGASRGPAMRRISAAIAAAEAKRFEGSADSARAVTPARGAAQALPAGMVGSGTRPLRRCVTIAAGCVFGNRGRPLSSSHRTTPMP